MLKKISEKEFSNFVEELGVSLDSIKFISSMQSIADGNRDLYTVFNVPKPNIDFDNPLYLFLLEQGEFEPTYKEYLLSSVMCLMRDVVIDYFMTCGMGEAEAKHALAEDVDAVTHFLLEPDKGLAEEEYAYAGCLEADAPTEEDGATSAEDKEAVYTRAEDAAVVAVVSGLAMRAAHALGTRKARKAIATYVGYCRLDEDISRANAFNDVLTKMPKVSTDVSPSPSELQSTRRRVFQHLTRYDLR